MDKYFALLNAATIKEFDKYRTRNEMIIFYEFFKRIYDKKPEYAEKIKSFLDQSKFDSIYTAFFEKNKSLISSTELVNK